jgi:hypothetical protein
VVDDAGEPWLIEVRSRAGCLSMHFAFLLLLPVPAAVAAAVVDDADIGGVLVVAALRASCRRRGQYIDSRSQAALLVLLLRAHLLPAVFG